MSERSVWERSIYFDPKTGEQHLAPWCFEDAGSTICKLCRSYCLGALFARWDWAVEHEKKHVAQLGEEQVKVFEAAVALGKIEKAVDLLALFAQVFPPEAIERVG